MGAVQVCLWFYMWYVATNTALPVTIYAFGAESQATVGTVCALAPAIPFYNFWAVLVLTVGKRHQGQNIAPLQTLGHSCQAIVRDKALLAAPHFGYALHGRLPARGRA